MKAHYHQKTVFTITHKNNKFLTKEIYFNGNIDGFSGYEGFRNYLQTTISTEENLNSINADSVNDILLDAITTIVHYSAKKRKS